MRTLEDVCRDDILDKLEQDITAPTSRPDQRRRWAMKAIERIRVTDLAVAQLLAEHPELRPNWNEIVDAAYGQVPRKVW